MTGARGHGAIVYCLNSGSGVADGMCSHIKDNLSGNMPVCSNADCQQPAISSASFDSATNIGTRVRRMRKLDRGE
ncbi:UNVERIFIED_CONTAM: hypothetical protein NCL1_42608 [Trichonephila clavipes]